MCRARRRRALRRVHASRSGNLHGHHFHGRPIQHGRTRQHVDALVVDHVIDARAGMLPLQLSAARLAGRDPSRAACRRRRASTSVRDLRRQHRRLPRANAVCTVAPSVMPRSAASCGWICNVQRGLPFTSRWLLCIHELLLRTWRRPISTNRGAGASSAVAARARSATNIGGARCKRRSGVASRRGKACSSAPRSMPFGWARNWRAG